MSKAKKSAPDMGTSEFTKVAPRLSVEELVEVAYRYGSDLATHRHGRNSTVDGLDRYYFLHVNKLDAVCNELNRRLAQPRARSITQLRELAEAVVAEWKNDADDSSLLDLYELIESMEELLDAQREERKKKSRRKRNRT